MTETRRWIILQCHKCGFARIFDNTKKSTSCIKCSTKLTPTRDKILHSTDNKTMAVTIYKSIKSQQMETSEPAFIRYKIRNGDKKLE